jgi:acyl carrier protein
MGLDGVEIVMAVEETFDMRIADSEAEKVRTPRHLIDLVWKQVAHADTTGCLSHRAFNRLRQLLMRRCALPRKAIVPTARLSDLLSSSQRREFADYVETDLGAAGLQLSRPTWLSAGLFTGAVLLGVATTLPLRLTSAGVSVLIAATVAIAVGYLFERGTRRLRTEFPNRLASVGDVSGWIVAHKPDLATGLRLQNAWTREQVALRVREIVVEHLGCEAQYHEDALFVEDLGLV